MFGNVGADAGNGGETGDGNRFIQTRKNEGRLEVSAPINVYLAAAWSGFFVAGGGWSFHVWVRLLG